MVLPASSFTSTLLKPFNDFANLTVKVSVLFPITPMLLSDNLDASVSPPTTLTSVPKVRSNFPASLLSPENDNGFAATSCTAVSSCDLFTASLPSVPGAILVIFLPPKSTPASLKVIVVPLPPILVMLLNTGFKE